MVFQNIKTLDVTLTASIMIQLYIIIVITCFFKTTHGRIAGSKSGNYAVPSGQTISMSCIPSNALVDKSRITGRRSFVWTDKVGKEIVNPRMTTLDTGELQIMHAHEADSGVYHCKFRPREALEHDGAASKIFEHKLIAGTHTEPPYLMQHVGVVSALRLLVQQNMYELPGHKFTTTVTFDVTKFGSETTVTELRHLLKRKVCASGVCAPGPVTTHDCEVTVTEKQMCEISMTYQALEPARRANCNETCIRQAIVDGLKKAQEVLESSLLAHSEDSNWRIKPDLQTFDTNHLITCKAGYHLIELNFEHCFPCQPGSYSKAETLKCEYCPIGFYQERYGSHDCEQCLYDLTTQTVGSKSRDDCRPITDTGILKGIKDGIAALFKG